MRSEQLFELCAYARLGRFVLTDDEKQDIIQSARTDVRRRADEYVLPFDRTQIADRADEQRGWRVQTSAPLGARRLAFDGG